VERSDTHQLHFMEMMGFAGSTHRAVDDLPSDVSRAIDLAWKRYHNGIGRFHPEREVTTGRRQVQTVTHPLQQGLAEDRGNCRD
jgi:hypothetical protein